VTQVISTYFGVEKPTSEIWALELSRVHATHRTVEADLFASRWFDYRHLLPGQATYLFAEYYSILYRKAYETTVDVDSSADISPFSPRDIFESSELTSMWLGRQAADAVGCPYDFYLRVVFARSADRGWRNIPRPNQLYSEEVVNDVSLAWGQRCKDVLQLATDSRFTAETYVGHPDQDAYYEWLAQQVGKRERPEYALCTILFKKKIITPSFAKGKFSTFFLRKAKALM
jgi:hypothetical protein